MKRILFLLTFLFASVAMFAQQTPVEEGNDYEAMFATFVGVVGVATVITEALKKLFKTPPTGWVSRLLSWGIGILLGLFAWIFNLGMFEDLVWWQSLLWGLGAGLASNGVYDTGLIEWLFSLFTKKKEDTSK